MQKEKGVYLFVHLPAPIIFAQKLRTAEIAAGTIYRFMESTSSRLVKQCKLGQRRQLKSKLVMNALRSES